jgi:hypothetical protein
MTRRLATFALGVFVLPAALAAGLAPAAPAFAGEVCGTFTCCTDPTACQCFEVTVGGQTYAKPCLRMVEAPAHGGA